MTRLEQLKRERQSTRFTEITCEHLEQLQALYRLRASGVKKKWMESEIDGLERHLKLGRYSKSNKHNEMV